MAMNDFNIGFLAGLDGTKSKAKLNQDIDAIKKSLKELELKAKLDPNQVKALENQLNILKVNLSNVSFDQASLNKLVSQINSSLSGIKLQIPNLNTGNVGNQAQQVGQQIGNNIAQGISSGVNKAKSELKSFSDLTNFSELNKKIEHLQIDPSALKNYSAILDEVKSKYAEFGQVKITNEQFNNGILEKFKVNIEQVNGDLKETKSFVMALNDDKDTFVFDGIIKGSESVVQHLDMTKNAINQTADAINSLQLNNKADKIQLSSDVSKLTTDYQKFGIVSQEVENNLKELRFAQEAVINAKGTDRLATEIEKYDTALEKAKSSWKELSATQVSLNQRTSQMTSMQEWMRKNKNATKLVGDQVKQLIEECRTCDAVRFNGIKNEFKELQVQASKAGKLGNTVFGGLVDQGKKFVQWVSVSGATMGLFNDIRQSISEIKELDNILTEISKTSNMTTQELKKLGMAAYDSASKYGRTASDYLTGVQEMSRSGFYGEKGTAMAEQSLLAQAAGDMNADLANNYILATNAAYKFNGEAEKLNAVLDGQNSITNRNSVAMEDMAVAMSEAGTVASSYRVSVEDLSAMIGTIESVTKLGGSEVGNGIKSILINLQNISSSKITSTLDKANASMTEFVNGTEQLRNPISILRDLAKTFNTLEESDPLRAEILSNIGGKYQAPKLAALLQNMTLFDKMLVDYSEGSGSAMEEASKSANNLE